MNIKTTCAQCVFAIRDTEGRQTDCEFGRLGDYEEYNNKGRKRPLDVAEDFGTIAFDESTKSYEIKGKLCNLSRSKNSPWAETVPPEQYQEKAFEEARLKFKVVILAMSDCSIEDFITTFRSVLDQTLDPELVHFVIYNKNISRAKLSARLAESEYGYDGIRRILDTDMTAWQCLDEETSASSETYKNYNYVCVLEPAKEIPYDYLEKIDYLVNKEMELVSMMAPKDGSMHGLVYSKMVREATGRDIEGTTAEKIEASGGVIWEAQL